MGAKRLPVPYDLQVKKMVGLVEQARMNKILQGLGTLQGAMTVKLNNLAAMEVNQVRAFFLGALDMFYKYQRVRRCIGAFDSQIEQLL